MKIKIKNKKLKYNYLKIKIKKFKKKLLLNNVNNNDLIQLMYKSTISNIDKCAQKKIIHKNKAARYKRKLNKSLKNLNLKKNIL